VLLVNHLLGAIEMHLKLIDRALKLLFVIDKNTTKKNKKTKVFSCQDFCSNVNKHTH
jgi:hypothetical protein